MNHGLADQVGWPNLREAHSGARVSLRRNWTAASIFSDWWLASGRDAFYNASGGIVARDPSGNSGTHVGLELDGETSYRINRSLELGAGVEPRPLVHVSVRDAELQLLLAASR